jgi:hypothetical protein
MLVGRIADEPLHVGDPRLERLATFDDLPGGGDPIVRGHQLVDRRDRHSGALRLPRGLSATAKLRRKLVSLPKEYRDQH